jgi:hypothetical protein
MLQTIAAGILLVTVTACTSWKPVLMRPESYIRMHDPEAVWVRLQDSSTLVLGRPRVFQDSLRGISAGAYRNIALKDVVQIRAEEPDKRKTRALIAASAVLAAGFIYMAANTDRTSQP